MLIGLLTYLNTNSLKLSNQNQLLSGSCALASYRSAPQHSNIEPNDSQVPGRWSVSKSLNFILAAWTRRCNETAQYYSARLCLCGDIYDRHSGVVPRIACDISIVAWPRPVAHDMARPRCEITPLLRHGALLWGSGNRSWLAYTVFADPLAALSLTPPTP